jgi:hypothetical protein
MAYYPLSLSWRDKAHKLKLIPNRRGVLAHLFDAMMASRRRQVDGKIARYLAATGSCDRLTDSIEREIERRFLRHRSTW